MTRVLLSPMLAVLMAMPAFGQGPSASHRSKPETTVRADASRNGWEVRVKYRDGGEASIDEAWTLEGAQAIVDGIKRDSADLGDDLKPAEFLVVGKEGDGKVKDDEAPRLPDWAEVENRFKIATPERPAGLDDKLREMKSSYEEAKAAVEAVFRRRGKTSESVQKRLDALVLAYNARLSDLERMLFGGRPTPLPRFKSATPRLTRAASEWREARKARYYYELTENHLRREERRIEADRADVTLRLMSAKYTGQVADGPRVTYLGADDRIAQTFTNQLPPTTGRGDDRGLDDSGDGRFATSPTTGRGDDRGLDDSGGGRFATSPTTGRGDDRGLDDSVGGRLARPPIDGPEAVADRFRRREEAWRRDSEVVDRARSDLQEKIEAVRRASLDETAIVPNVDRLAGAGAKVVSTPGVKVVKQGDPDTSTVEADQPSGYPRPYTTGQTLAADERAYVDPEIQIAAAPETPSPLKAGVFGTAARVDPDSRSVEIQVGPADDRLIFQGVESPTVRVGDRINPQTTLGGWTTSKTGAPMVRIRAKDRGGRLVSPSDLLRFAARPVGRSGPSRTAAGPTPEPIADESLPVKGEDGGIRPPATPHNSRPRGIGSPSTAPNSWPGWKNRDRPSATSRNRSSVANSTAPTTKSIARRTTSPN